MGEAGEDVGLFQGRELGQDVGEARPARQEAEDERHQDFVAADVRAAEAVALFCYQAKKWIGAFAAALGGLDTLVFSAGIGERSAAIRARICEGLGFLGIELHDTRNQAHAAVISTAVSRVTVRVIPTDEELMVARSVSRLLRLNEDITETKT